MRRKSLHLFLVFALTVTSLAQQKRTDDISLSVERLRDHISYLASDKLEGRRTGTPGAEMAAEYIAREFARYGLRASNDEVISGEAGASRYLRSFPYVAGVKLGRDNLLSFTRRAMVASSAPFPAAAQQAATLDLRLEEDWMPLGFSSNARINNAPATFVGHGISASDLKHDDYAGQSVTGRIVIALAGTPDGDNPHGQFARYREVRFKASTARARGAAALILVSGEENFRDERLARLRYDNSAGDAGLPVVVISRNAAARILSAGGLAPLTELEKALKRSTSSAPSNTNATSGNATNDASQTRQNSSMPLENVALTVVTDIVRRRVRASNVVGILEGTDSRLKEEAVVIGAHYDHLGLGGEGSLAAREGEVHHGADDNASGVAGMLEVARTLARKDAPKLRRTVVFIAFGGEEEGLLGSNYYVNHPAFPISQTVAMINMDMIGRMKENKLIVGGVGTAQEWRGWIEAANMAKGLKVTASTTGQNTPSRRDLPLVVGANGQAVVSLDPGKQFTLTLNEDGYGPSDHSSFYAKQIPVLFFWTGTHEDYHKPTDTAEKINYEGEARILDFILNILRSIDAMERRPTYTVAKTEATGRSMGFRVYLGTIPSYADSTEGLKLDGVREDSPAAKAGLKAGDVIVRLAGRDVRNVYDYTEALGEMKAGQEYEVEVMRAGERLKLKITPAARK
jgi:aminopeptidase YwaD